MELGEVIATHQPDKTDIGKTAFQRFKRVDGITRAKHAFDIERNNARMARNVIRLTQSIPQRRQTGVALKRIFRRHQPPDIVQLQAFQRHKADVQVTMMRRIEGTAQKTNAQTAR